MSRAKWEDMTASSLGTRVYDYVHAPKKTAIEKVREATAGGGYERVTKERESAMQKALRESGAE